MLVSRFLGILILYTEILHSIWACKDLKTSVLRGFNSTSVIYQFKMGFLNEISQVNSMVIKWKKIFILVSPFLSRLLGFKVFAHAKWLNLHPPYNKGPIKCGQRSDFQRCPWKGQPMNSKSCTCFRLTTECGIEFWNLCIHTYIYILLSRCIYSMKKCCFTYLCAYKSVQKEGEKQKILYSF